MRGVLAGALSLALLGGGARAQGMEAMPGMPAMPAVSPAVPSGATMTGQLGAYAMTRDASGTAWQPDSTPMEGVGWRAGGWTGTAGGYVDLVQDVQEGPRGGALTFSESMLMAMAQHEVGPGVVTFRSMLSLDPAMGEAGYPLLLQTGETADGLTPLIDRQHPHDLFMELAAAYSAPVGGGSSAFVYVGYPGEPALGPVTFMDRFSAMNDPAAPITHHWLDSTHTAYGVVTAGLVRGPWKIEGSAFNGREPDQNRWNFDPPRLDSWSGRLSWNPTPDWSLQASYGAIHSPEQLDPAVNQRRLTASATWNRRLPGGNCQTTLAWGRDDDQPGHVLDGFLLESAVNIGLHTVFARAETVRKDDLFQPLDPLAGRVFRVSELSLGYVYDLPIARHLAIGFGLLGTANLVPAALAPTYGGDPAGFMPFLRLKVR